MSWLSFIIKSVGKWLQQQCMRWDAYRTHKIILPQGAVIRKAQAIRIGKNFGISNFCQIYCQDPEAGSRIVIGDRVALNTGVMINADCGGEIVIGDNVLIGPNVVIRASNHTAESVTLPIREQGHSGGKIVIEDDVWLGANVVVLPNVMLGKGSIIGAGSVVNADIASFGIAVGVPAKVIKFRGEK